ncbi:uncharacterized protein V1518DRAFT_435512 [Limtongia smithiae]|uniref:uncharacterized protein n=1 Tax=Limtongia smithiae TaxID=1125753 RepID=UPI0034CDA0D2
MPSAGEKFTRAYRACTSCRARKAKCIFRDASYEPPCDRCYREGKQCSFLPSRRGGRANIDNGRAHRAEQALTVATTATARTATSPDASSTHSSDTTAIHQLSTTDSQRSSNDLESTPTSKRQRTGSISVSDSGSKAAGKPPDALNILARAAEYSNDEDSENEDEPTDKGSIVPGASAENRVATNVSTTGDAEDADGDLQRHAPTRTFSDVIDATIAGTKAVTEDDGAQDRHIRDRRSVSMSRYQEQILEFIPIKRGLLNPIQLRTFLSIYFSRHYHYLLLVPYFRAPLNDKLLSDFCRREPHLLTAMVIVASRYENQEVHDQCWNYMQTLITELAFGTHPTVGAIESLILLSENIPRLPAVDTKRLHYHEERMAWTLIGLAVRLSYYLGLDQKTLLSLTDVIDEETHRERLVWIYCYMHDRQESIRLGQAFWSRAPGLCFQIPDSGTSIMLDSSVNFPTLSMTNGNLEDYASHVQAQIELTQMLTNIHDTLYTSRDKTLAFVWVGEYYRILDEYTRSFNAFRLTWQQKSWDTFSLNETLWITFHYTKLYAYGFAFKSHLQRRIAKYKEALNGTPSKRLSLRNIIFPRGLVGSPDAKFILESEQAAIGLLEICINSLHAGGALAYLPARFYWYITYAVVFLIKLVFTGAMVPKDQQSVMSLVRQAIAAFVELARTTDKQHPLVRRTNQLYTLLRKLWNAESSGTAAGGPATSAMHAGVNTSTHLWYSGVNGTGDQLQRTEATIAAGALAPTPDVTQGDVPAMHTSACPRNARPVDDSNLTMLDDGLSNIMDLLPFEIHLADSERGEGSADLISLLSIDIDSEIWMSYFDSWSYEQTAE